MRRFIARHSIGIACVAAISIGLVASWIAFLMPHQTLAAMVGLFFTIATFVGLFINLTNMKQD